MFWKMQYKSILEIKLKTKIQTIEAPLFLLESTDIKLLHQISINVCKYLTFNFYTYFILTIDHTWRSIGLNGPIHTDFESSHNYKIQRNLTI